MNQILQNNSLSLKKHNGKNLLISSSVTLTFAMPLSAILLNSLLPAAPAYAQYLTANDLSILVPLDIGFLFGLFSLFLPGKAKTTVIIALFGILINAAFFLSALFSILARTIPANG